MSRKNKKAPPIQNIFAELGLEHSEELVVRAQLLDDVATLIRKTDLSQKDVAEKLGIAQSKVSKLVNGRLSEFSTDTLLNYLSILGCDVQIKVRKPRTSSAIFKNKGRIGVGTLPAKRKRTARNVKNHELSKN